MGNLLRGWWDRVRRFYRCVSWEPTGTEIDALSPEECDAIAEQNRQNWQRKQIAKGIRSASPENRPPE